MNIRYDEAGNRIAKITHNSSGAPVRETWYARDPAGNVLAVYEKDLTQTTPKAVLTEYPIYGAGRIGVMYPRTVINEYEPYQELVRYRVVYELTDHLGTVRATIKADQYDIDYPGYDMQLLSTTDYYPYGAPMPGKNWTSGTAYRAGFQGQYSEKDPETDWNAFKLRMYDANIGRWLSVDPYRQYASSYIGMGGNPVSGVDPDGGICENCPTDGNFSNAVNSSQSYTYNASDGTVSLTNFETGTMLSGVTVQGVRPPSTMDLAIKWGDMANTLVSAPYEIGLNKINKTAAQYAEAVSKLTKTGKTILKLTPVTGLALTSTDNAIEIKENGVQTSNTLDILMYGGGLAVGATVGAIPAFTIVVVYGSYEIWDMYNGKKGTNFINHNFPINGR